MAGKWGETVNTLSNGIRQETWAEVKALLQQSDASWASGEIIEEMSSKLKQKLSVFRAFALCN